MFTAVRMKKLFAIVTKNHIGKVISALSDTGACHFIEKPGSKLNLINNKILLHSIERRVDEILFKIPMKEHIKVDLNIFNDVDLMLYELAKDITAKEKIITYRLINIKKALIHIKSVYNVLENFEETQYTYFFEAWIPEDRQKIVSISIDEASNGRCAVQFSDPEFGETPPTMLSNPAMMKSFENLVKRYGLPSYYEIDPTFIIFITFPLIFGMMYGDTGHGIMLFLLSTGLFLLGNRYKHITRFKEFSPILMISAVFSIFFGFMYGEFFGLNFSPIWLNPSRNVIYFLIISVWAGVLHLVLGLILNGINLWRNKKYLRAVFQVQWIIFSGSSILFYTRFLHEESGTLIRSFLLLIMFPGIVMIMCGILINRIEGKGTLSGIMIPFYLGLKYAMHLMSYLRLLIMSLAHSAISATIIALRGDTLMSLMLMGLITFILIIIVETFVVFIQTLRLHWVEWFYLFYKGKGIEFSPFKISQTAILH